VTRNRPVEVLCRSKVERHLTTFPSDFVAVLGFLFDRPSWTSPRIRGLCITPNRCLWARVNGDQHDRFMGSEEVFLSNVERLARAAGLTPAEHFFLAHLFRLRTQDLATK
jgi:hypothetical protein